MLDRRLVIGGLAAAAFAGVARAHHGWEWAEDKSFEITGVIKSAKLGNPHGILKIDVKKEEWTVEVGQPWRKNLKIPPKKLLWIFRISKYRANPLPFSSNRVNSMGRWPAGSSFSLQSIR